MDFIHGLAVLTFVKQRVGNSERDPILAGHLALGKSVARCIYLLGTVSCGCITYLFLKADFTS